MARSAGDSPASRDMKKLGLIFVSFAMAVLSAGCATHEDTGTLVGAGTGALIGSQFGRGGGRVASTVAGAVVGGFIGNRIGASMDEEDRRRAAAAQYTAFENGNRAEWRSPTDIMVISSRNRCTTTMTCSAGHFHKPPTSTEGLRQ